MSETHTFTGNKRGPARYEIRIQGHLASRWTGWFSDLAITLAADGTTLIAGVVVDQAALHALLRKIRDLGVPLLSLRRVDTDSKHSPLDPYVIGSLHVLA